VNAAQHRLFETLVQSASESRAQMHEAAWFILGVLLVMGLVALCGLLMWISNGGLAEHYALYCANDPNAAKALRHR
jgi:hypothetical protein